jgi:uncharacterized membrane protein
MNITVRKRKPEFILVFLAGLIIIAQGLTFFAGLFIGLPKDEMLEGIRSTIGDERFSFLLIRAGIAGVSTGALLILLSILIERYEDTRRFGAMVIVISIVSILGIGFINIGMLPGIILAIAGGILTVKRGKGSIFAESKEYKGINEYSAMSITTPSSNKDNMIYLCSRCNIEFANDEELKKHIIKFHTDDIIK